MTIVRINVKNDDIPQSNVSGVFISVYSIEATFITSGSTDNTGVVTFSLPDNTYDLLFFKQGMSIQQPQRIIVNSNLSNNFLISGHIRAMPESIDPILCRVSGYINSVDGKAVDNIDVRFNQLPINIIANGNFVFNDPVQATSDKRGYFDFYLLRGVSYEASIAGYNPALISKVPNYPAVNVADLLFPLPVRISLTTSSITLDRVNGPNSSIGYTAYYSDLNTGRLANDWSSIQFDASVNGIVSLGATDTNLVLTPISTGTTQITFVRYIDPRYVWINPSEFIQQTLTVNVV